VPWVIVESFHLYQSRGEIVNVCDPFEVERAIATRMKAGNGIVITPGEAPVLANILIDATEPFKERQWYEKVGVHGVEKSITGGDLGGP
jgi:hypothetical protein